VLSRSPGDSERSRLGAVSGAGLGVAVLWLSLLVLLPLAAIVVKAAGGGWNVFSFVFTDPDTRDALLLTVGASLLVCLINAVMGTLIAWVLVRDRFWGKRLIEVVIDIPFALPTIVAGLVLQTLYGPTSPLGVNFVGTRRGIIVALLFVTLPFVVRTVQPVLMSLESDVEEAAASLGAGPLVVFRRILLPTIGPAIASGTALAFARAMGEYGSVLLISGALDRKTVVASMQIYNDYQDGAVGAAAGLATVLLLISVLVLIVLDLTQRRAARRG
jgi:sulfate transport system permease protein